jgi:small subunit ribosomal protein S4
MGSYKGPRARLSRKAGMDLNSFGLKSLEQKTKYAGQRPGQPGKRRPPASKFGEQQNAVNCMVDYYHIRGKQFKNYFMRAKSMSGSTDEVLIQLLESRLDSVVFAMGFALTKREARQMVTHKHITVNGKLVNSPSYAVSEGDVVAVAEKAKDHQRVALSVSLAKDRQAVEWLECDYEALSGTYQFHPSIKHINLFDQHMLGLIIVYFSK